ncbi:MAG: hypothetical protein L6R36_007878 [Xanthoria steineri]|nr:MAG: hypothetical protein L6R36_007878 [Xanthoria steineri]
MQANEQNISNLNGAPASSTQASEGPTDLAACFGSPVTHSSKKRTRDESSELQEAGSAGTVRRRITVQDLLQEESASAESSTPSTPITVAKSDDAVINTAPEAILLGPAEGLERSILRRLPMELRLHIYSLALAADDMAHPLIHEGITTPKVPEVLVFLPRIKDHWIPPHSRHKYRLKDTVVSASSRRSNSKRAALLRTCRQVYTETVDSLYQQRTFIMTERSFTALAAMIPQHSLDRIRHMQFTLQAEALVDLSQNSCGPQVPSQWITFWPIVAKMRNLQTLSVKIRNLVGNSKEFPDDHRWRAVLEPLLALRGLERFDLQYQAESVPIAGHPGSIFYSFKIPLPEQTLALIEEIKEAATRPRLESGDSA